MIDSALVRNLITAQFPEWQDLSILPVAMSGWDNRSFHLGKDMLVRMPSSAEYAAQVEKEQRWLPRLSKLLPLQIPEPLAIGQPAAGYPWKWSVYRWIKGETIASVQPIDLCDIAASLGKFLTCLQHISPTGGPLPGPHSFYRGGELATYDTEVRQALDVLTNKINTHAAINLWESALATSWQQAPVWVHGDISAGNLLVREEQLVAVIDFGQLTIGDPACDLAIAWTLFQGKSRETFRTNLPLDEGTWARGRAWALWKALIVAAGFTNPNTTEGKGCWHIIDEVLG